MNIQETLRVEGRLHANGEGGHGQTGGGGAGGSIYLKVKHLDGSGSIEATGGRGMLYILLVLKNDIGNF